MTRRADIRKNDRIMGDPLQLFSPFDDVQDVEAKRKGHGAK